MEHERKLEKYAEVIVKIGLGLQPGQRLIIGVPMFGVDGTPLEAHSLVRKVSRAAYQAGARYVGVNWDDEELQRIRVANATTDSMAEFATWKNEVVIEYIDRGDAIAAVVGQNPDLMSGLEPEKVQAKQQTEAQHFHRLFAKLAAGETNWLAFGAAVSGWANKVFPEQPQSRAISSLWQAIFAACRIDEEDPVAAWQQHIVELGKRAAYLNNKKYRALACSAPGTDLTVGLPEGHLWHSGSLTTQKGQRFVANLPTEEVFTMPHRGRVDGTVTATKPLSYGGSLIDRFTLTFVEGRVVDATAAVGQAVLDSLLRNDENSRFLGEVALVPHSSPISQSNLLFYNTLYDENASCHLALGNAYRFNMAGGEGMSGEEFAAAGGNESISHADFMIGSGDMDIDGITVGGTAESIMRRGEWAFAV